ncbi:hypothetical protein MMC07_006980 [Pseudocyphellaria aurata]|nr:hypothetical protein [Pseudocyphellaria aurata]
MLPHFLPVGAIALSSLLQYAEAAPGFPPKTASSLSKRFNTFVGCGDPEGPEVDPKRSKAGQALADMANLALHAYDEASADKYGFKHYFRDYELHTFKTAMSAIAENNDPTNAPYNFIINCDPTDHIAELCDKDGGSYAITDAAVPADDNDHKSIWLCPLFFTGDDTKNNLPNTENADELQAWCNQKDYTSFPTAGIYFLSLTQGQTLYLLVVDKFDTGHVLLHEITHLDAVAKIFLPDGADEEGRHGTLDWTQGSRPIYDARRLKVRVDNDPNRPDPAPSFNAESYAGAATELWAQKFCQKEFIPPKNGYEP